MTEILYCANGCTRPSNGERIPVTTEPPSRICRRCEDNLREWLREIPERYALLPQHLAPGSIAREADVVVPKRTEAPAPIRLDVLDLLDHRRGRHWQGIIPAEDWRGVVGTLHVTAQRIRTEKPLTTPAKRPTVTSETKLIERHLLWLVEQDWVDVAYEEVRTLHRDLGNAIGVRRPTPVGTCVIAGNDEDECGGPLLPSRIGGVYCPRCQTQWPIEQLRLLGAALTQPEAS